MCDEEEAGSSADGRKPAVGDLAASAIQALAKAAEATSAASDEVRSSRLRVLTAEAPPEDERGEREQRRGREEAGQRLPLPAPWRRHVVRPCARGRRPRWLDAAADGDRVAGNARTGSPSTSSKRTTVTLSSPPASFAARRAPRRRRRIATGGPRRRRAISSSRTIARQPVRAEQEEVAVRGVDRERVDLDVGLGAERARDHGALRVGGGLVLGQAAAAHELATSEWSPSAARAPRRGSGRRASRPRGRSRSFPPPRPRARRSRRPHAGDAGILERALEDARIRLRMSPTSPPRRSRDGVSSIAAAASREASSPAWAPPMPSAIAKSGGSQTYASSFCRRRRPVSVIPATRPIRITPPPAGRCGRCGPRPPAAAAARSSRARR